jgi:heat shock protein 4
MANTVTYIKRFVGSRFAEANIQAEIETHVNFNPVELPDGTVGYEVQYAGEEATFSTPQVTAMLLTKCRQIVIFNNPGCQTVDMVIAVPPFFTDAQRRCIKDAAHIAGVNCLRVLNEGTASALSYGIFKGAKKEFAEGKETVCMFLDMGAASFTATVASFTNASLKVLASVSDNDLGGRVLDVAIAKYFAAEFMAKTKIDAWKNKKGRVKLMVAAEKAKISISPHGVNSTPVSIECLLEDRDFNGSLTTEKLEELCGATFATRMGSVISRALTQSGARDYADFAAIELVGGSMRVRLIKRAAAVALKMPLDEAAGHGLNQSMNLDEAVARGCALACAALSPVFKVKPFEVIDIVSYPVQLAWDGAGAAAAAPAADNAMDADDAAEAAVAGAGAAGAAGSVTVFKAGDPAMSRQVTLRKVGTFSATLEYMPSAELHANIFPAGAQTLLGRYTVSGFPADLGAEVPKVRLTVKYDFDGCVSISSAEVLREIKDAAPGADSAAPAGEGAEGAAAAAAAEGGAAPADGASKAKKRYKKIALKVELEAGHSSSGVGPGQGLSVVAVREGVEAEIRMNRSDADIRLTQDTRNSLEAFIYSTRSDLEGGLKPFGTEGERGALSSALGDAETWLYGDGFESDTKTYKAKLKDLETKAAALMGRKWESDNRRPSGEALLALVEDIRAAVSNRTQKHGHLSDSDRDVLRACADKAENWFRGVQQEQQSRELFQDPTVKVADISARRDALLREASPILNAKPPAPAASAAPPPPAPTSGGAPPPSEPMDTDSSAPAPDTKQADAAMD